MPQLDPAVFAPQLIWLAISFAVLYFLMAKVALPRIGNALDARQEKIDDNLTAAEELRGSAQADEAAEPQHDRALPLLSDARRQHQHQPQDRHRDHGDWTAREERQQRADRDRSEQDQDRHDVGPRWVGGFLAATRSDQGHGHTPFWRCARISAATSSMLNPAAAASASTRVTNARR